MRLAPIRVALAAAVAFAPLAGCGSDSPTAPASIAGSYTATTFRVVPSGQPALDVLAGGGSLAIVINADNTTTGRLFVPAAVAGGEEIDDSMAGTAVRTGNTVQFQQGADTFVRDLDWAVSGRTLQVTNQTAGAGTFTIVLTRR